MWMSKQSWWQIYTVGGWGSISIAHLLNSICTQSICIARVYLDSPFVPRLEMVWNLHHSEQVDLSPGWSNTILPNPILLWSQSNTILQNPIPLWSQSNTILQNLILLWSLQYMCPIQLSAIDWTKLHNTYFCANRHTLIFAQGTFLTN